MSPEEARAVLEALDAYRRYHPLGQLLAYGEYVCDLLKLADDAKRLDAALCLAPASPQETP